MEQLSELLKLIGTYGLSIVISAIVIIMFVSERKNLRKDFEKLLEARIDQEKVQHTPEQDHKYDSTYETITDILNTLRTQIDCARCYVFMYHNGGKNLRGVPFQRLSCISEVVAPGIEPIINMYQQCQRSMFSSVCNELKNNNHLYIDDISHLIDKDPMLYSILEKRSTNSAYFLPIKDYQTNTIIGFTGVEFIESYSPDEIKRMKKLFAEATVRTSSLLEVISNDSDHFSK